MANPNRQEIDVVLTPVTPSTKWPDGIKFELSSPIGSSDKLTFKNNGRPGFRLRFHIVDDHKTGYLFPDDEEAAMWVCTVNNATDPCPKSASHWPTFEATDVTDGNKTLKVTNHNNAPQLFKFTLLFTKTPDENGPCIEFDPIGDNRNGVSLNVNSGLAIAAGAVALALGALVFFLARKR